MSNSTESRSDERFEKFTALILDINRQIQRIKSEEMAEFGLSGVHVNILFQLDRSENGLSQSELVRLCGEDKAYISRSVAYLTERGIVTSGGEIGRRYNAVVKLTELGKRYADSTLVKTQNAVRAGSEGLSDADREVLYRCLATVSRNLKSYVVPTYSDN